MSERVAEVLARAGMSPSAMPMAEGAFAAARAGWLALVARPSQEGRQVPGAPDRHRDAPRALYVPGRIEVLGKHTDYAGGATLTCAVERGVCAMYSARRDAVVRLLDSVDARAIEFAVDGDLVIPIGDWANYPMTVARRVARNFDPPLAGMDVAFRNTLPVSAGMSSSSALMTAVFLALADVNALRDRPRYRANVHDLTDLATYLGTIENGQPFGTLAGDHGVGTFGGSEDHTAILCSEPGRVGHFEFCPGRRIGTVPVPDGCTFVIASSGVAAQKTGNARERYNRASLLVAELLRLWREVTGEPHTTLRAAVHSAPDAAARLDAIAREARSARYPARDLARRLQHFLLENEHLVPAAAQALTAGDTAAFGRVADESQRGTEDLLQNQVPETITLARLARELGAVAASAFGAGFGGSVWALVGDAQASRFPARWHAAYASAAAPDVVARSTFFVTAAGPPATALSK